MKKKRHVPAPQRSAFEDAKAALERAGEDPSELQKTPVENAQTPDSAEAPVSAPVENAETSAPVESAQASGTADSAAPETATSAPETPETAETSAPETADNAETPVPAFNAQAQEVADSAEASETASDAENAEASAPENAETSEPETSETAEASDSAEAPVSETADNAESGIASETEENIAATPETNAEPSDASAPEAADGGAEMSDSGADAEASEPLDDEEDASDDGGDDVWEYADEPEAEIAETERHMMETKEITVGYHPIRTADASEHSGTEAAKSKKKPRFKPLDALKDAFRASAEPETEERDADNPPAGSSRDAALRKRVMQIEDDETRNYLLDRVLPQMTWYSKRSSQYQTKYHKLMTVAILMGALIPIFSVCANGGLAFKVILAFLGASVTAVNAYLALYKYQELWIAYRGAREELIHTLYSYFNQAGVFAQKKMTQKELNILLVEVCENTLSKENGGWTTTILQKTS